MGIPGSVKKFDKRSGGYLNYQYNSETPEKNNPDFMLEEDKANQMLKEANDFIQKYFPWMKDFVVFQLYSAWQCLYEKDRRTESKSQ